MNSFDRSLRAAYAIGLGIITAGIIIGYYTIWTLCHPGESAWDVLLR